ncbi:ATP-binding protein [Microbacterium sp. NPDC055665]
MSEIPPEHTSFVGRRSELARARRLLEESSLVTIVGAGGVGKSRLAIRAAAGLRRSFKDGIYFIDLTTTSESNQVADAVTGAMGVRVWQVGAEIALMKYLAARTVLIVLDNCEHVADGVASLVTFLIARSPTVKILCTSRETLRIAGERVCLLAPLPIAEPERASTELSPAAELFLDRIADWVPRDSVDATDLAHVEAICRGVDGIPLAVELAASRTRVLSVSQLAERIREPLDAVSTGPRGSSRRTRTLRSAIEWSFDLCTPREQQAWSRMAVFGGLIDLEATTHTMTPLGLDEAETLRLLESLAEKSIVSRVEFGRRVWYRMFETLRHFGLERLPPRQLLEARRAHRDWYVQRLRDASAAWIGPDQASWLSYFLHELPNIRAALEFALSTPGEEESALPLLTLGWRIVWQAHGRLDELRAWLNRALVRTSQPTTSRSFALTLHGVLAGLYGEHATAHEDFIRSRLIADQLQDDVLRSYIDGAIATLMPDSEESIALYRRAIALQRDDPSAAVDSGFTVRLALALDRLGRSDESLKLRTEILRQAEMTGERYECSSLLLNAGAIAMRRSDSSAARALTRHALVLQRELGNAMGMAQAIQTLAGVALHEGDAQGCALLLGAAQPLWRRSGTLPSAVPLFHQDARDFEGRARARLGASQYRAAFDRGSSFSIDDGIRVALGEKRRPEGRSTSLDAPQLTAREWEVASLIAEGLSNQSIAQRLVLSVRTVHGHVQRVLTKLNMTSRTQVAAWYSTTRSSQDRHSIG